MSLSPESLSKLAVVIQAGADHRPELFDPISVVTHAMPGIQVTQVYDDLIFEIGNTQVGKIHVLFNRTKTETGIQLEVYSLGVIGFHTNYFYNVKSGAMSDTAEKTAEQFLAVLEGLYNIPTEATN